MKEKEDQQKRINEQARREQETAASIKQELERTSGVLREMPGENVENAAENAMRVLRRLKEIKNMETIEVDIKINVENEEALRKIANAG